MSKLLPYLLIFVVCLLPENLLAADAPGNDDKPGSLIVGVVQEDNFPLVFFDEQNIPTGFEVEMVHHLAEIGGYEIGEIKQYPDGQALRRALTNGELDIAISKLKKNKIDAEHFIFANSYLSVGYVFLFNRTAMARQNLQIDPLQKLASGGPPVGTLDSPLYADQLRILFPEMTIRSYQTKQEVFDAVASGEVTACYMDEMEVKSFFLTNPAKALYLQYVQTNTVTDSVSIVLPWDKLFFREWVNLFLDKYGYINTDLGALIERYSPELLKLHNQ